jgi:formate-dependent nitrite reductase membrane component NrfD
MIGVINSVLVGTFAGLLLSALFTFPLLICTSAGVVTFLVSFGIHQRYQWRRLEQNLMLLFQAN